MRVIITCMDKINYSYLMAYRYRALDEMRVKLISAMESKMKMFNNMKWSEPDLKPIDDPKKSRLLFEIRIEGVR